MAVQKREHWNSVLGFILAAAGSAIGLGNIWRFPYITGKNGGGMFVLLYLAIVFLVGLPLMYVEMSVGRFAQRGPVGSMKKLAPDSFWSIIGFLAIITGIAILSYYGVVAGWTFWYLLKAVFQGFKQGEAGNLFVTFTSNGWYQIALLYIFMGLTTGIVYFGVKGGIEKLSSLLMPVLLLLLVGLIIYAFTLPTAKAGLKYYLLPKTSDLKMTTFIYALGQAFFSLSLGMGAMMTYGSYLSGKENLIKAGMLVVIFDTLIAIMAGLIIFPVLGGAPEKSGSGLVFIVLTDLFTKLPGGRLLAIIFFLLLTVAALTSTISLLEVASSYLIDERKIPRKKASLIVGGITFLVGIPSALSVGASKHLSAILSLGGSKKGFLELMDYFFGNISLTVGGLLLAFFAVYKWKLSFFEKELFKNTKTPKAVKFILRPLIIVVVPGALITVLGYMLVTGKGLG